MPPELPSDEIRIAATAIANCRGIRRGVPYISNILELIPEQAAEEAMEDAAAAIDAVEQLRKRKRAAGGAQ